jgi:glutathione synthase
MPLKVAIQMDPLGSINPATDSTLLMMLEAQARGHELWHYTPDKLTWHDGNITASAHHVKVHVDPNHHYDMGAESIINLKQMDVVLLRQDPPFNMEYITTTYILEQLHPDTLVVNNPTAVRDLPEKLFPTLMRQLMPPTLITADVKEIESFRDEHKDIVLKPLYGYAGRSVVRVSKDSGNLHSLVEMFFSHNREPLIAQKFLPEVKTGDRRIIIIDGKLAGIMGRIPAEGEIRANFRVGGTAAKVEITKRQQEICEMLGPELKKRGLIFAGVDTIGDWLTEINITSPTGFPAMNRLYGKKLEADFWNAVERYLP